MGEPEPKLRMSEAEKLTCERCGKAIAAAAPGNALCCRCRYGQMKEGPDESARDAVEEMNREHGRWQSGSAFSPLHVCPQCGLERRTCMCE